MNHKPGSVHKKAKAFLLLPSVLNYRFRQFLAVYPRLTGGLPARCLTLLLMRLAIFLQSRKMASGFICDKTRAYFPAIA